MLPEYPYACPDCGNNLEEPGMVYAEVDLPEEVIGHVDPRDDGKLDFVTDLLLEPAKLILACAGCGCILSKIEKQIEDVYLGDECEVEEVDD